jgi:hypothetical protein
MDARDLRARVARGRAIAVTGGWTAISTASRLLAGTAGFLARRSVQLAVAMRAFRRRLDRIAQHARARARLAPPAAQPTVEVMADSTVVMPLPPVVPGLPRVPPPPGALASNGARLPPPPRSRRTDGALPS